MHYIRIVNWLKYQHYKNRRPPWIKLYSKLLRKYEFICLQDDSKLLLMFLWLLASTIEKDDPLIPSDPKYLKQQLPFKGKIDLQPLIKQGFIELIANCKQNDSKLRQTEAPYTETETETETEEETETEKKKKGFQPPLPLEVVEYAMTINYPIDGNQFIDFYSSKNWMIGKNKMSDWRAAVRTWKRRDGMNPHTGKKEETTAEQLARIEREGRV